MIKLSCFLLKRFTQYLKTVLALMLVLTLSVQANNDVIDLKKLPTDELIKQGLAVKSYDSKLSRRILERLTARTRTMDGLQLNQYKYLLAYEQILMGNYQQAINYSKSNTNSRYIKYKLAALNNIMFLNVLLGQYLEASEVIKPILIALKRFEPEQETTVNTYTTLAYFYNELDQPQQALNYIEHILTADNMQLTERQQCFLGMQHIYALQGLNELSTNDPYISRYYNLCKTINEQLLVEEIAATQAFLLLKNQQPQQAIELLLANYESMAAQKYPPNYLRFNSYLAKAHFQLNNLSKASEFADKALSISFENQLHPAFLIAYEVNFNLAKHNKNKQAEFNTLRNKVNLQHKLALKAKEKALALSGLAYDLDELERELIGYSLRINSHLKEEEIKLEHNTIFSHFLISNRIIQLILFGFIFFLTKSVIANVKLKKQIVADLIIDKMTDCLHRHAFLEQAQQALDNAPRKGPPFSLVIMNIDNLRDVNENQGNDRADRLIKLVLSKHIFDPQTLVGRLGGDEFVFLLKDCSANQAIEICEEYRIQTNFLDTKPICYQFDVTTRFGVSDTHISGFNIMNLLIDTEQAVTQATDECKNCTCCFEGVAMQELSEPQVR
ncbi:GGDEF domain-containing protein [Thalassotalea nanhaiensis]|uniref:diguanylate cyclase n=1 Tax=Thalassotalea nanhaiensis TaxID=3065648 RepID=A0ABY9TH39_9GAMM|nr:GGDEF domain-containing protein [Colwelliaceae bacterium SQ345]